MQDPETYVQTSALLKEWLVEVYPSRNIEIRESHWLDLGGKVYLDIYAPGDPVDSYMYWEKFCKTKTFSDWSVVLCKDVLEEGLDFEEACGFCLLSDPEFFEKLKGFCDEVFRSEPV